MESTLLKKPDSVGYWAVYNNDILETIVEVYTEDDTPETLQFFMLGNGQTAWYVNQSPPGEPDSFYCDIQEKELPNNWDYCFGDGYTVRKLDIS